MTKIAVGIEYDGSGYYGWQAQTLLPSIQRKIEEALAKIADAPIALEAAGRTDKGVHATEQVGHFVTDASRDLNAWVRGANTYLPADIKILWAKEVAADFHARYSAIERTYHYVIYNHTIAPAILESNVTWYRQLLDLELMQQAADLLLGEHDFSTFRSSECQANTPIRTIRDFTIIRQGRFVVIQVTANAFLHHMIRNLVGTLVKVAGNEQPVSWVKEILLAKDRSLVPKMAAANGLYLTTIKYDVKYALPQNIHTQGPWFLWQD